MGLLFEICIVDASIFAAPRALTSDSNESFVMGVGVVRSNYSMSSDSASDSSVIQV